MKKAIVLFVPDLIFLTFLENAVRRSGFEPVEVSVTWLKSNFKQEAEASSNAFSLSDHLVDYLSQLQPALVIVDIGDSTTRWREWLSIIKTDPSTRRIPVICFGPHVNAEALQTASNLGPEVVTGRSNIHENIETLIIIWALVKNPADYVEGCNQELAKVAQEGIQAFNQGRFFEAHELLEHAWNNEPTPGQDLYRALLQTAVAYYQIERSNYRGAIKIFRRLRQWINPLPDVCRGVNIKKLKEDVEKIEALLPERNTARGGEGLIFQPIEYHGFKEGE